MSDKKILKKLTTGMDSDFIKKLFALSAEYRKQYTNLLSFCQRTDSIIESINYCSWYISGTPLSKSSVTRDSIIFISLLDDVLDNQTISKKNKINVINYLISLKKTPASSKKFISELEFYYKKLINISESKQIRDQYISFLRGMLNEFSLSRKDSFEEYMLVTSESIGINILIWNTLIEKKLLSHINPKTLNEAIRQLSYIVRIANDISTRNNDEKIDLFNLENKISTNTANRYISHYSKSFISYVNIHFKEKRDIYNYLLKTFIFFTNIYKLEKNFLTLNDFLKKNV